MYLCGEALPWTRPPVHWEARRPLNSVEAAAAYAALVEYSTAAEYRCLRCSTAANTLVV